MKLLAKYNRINILATIGIFLLGSIAFYFVLRHILIRQLDESLESEKEEIVQYVQQFNQLPLAIQTADQQVDYRQTNEFGSKKKFISLNKFNPVEKHKESYRELHFTINANKQFYEVTVSKSQTATEDLIQLIILVTVGMIALILITGFLINRTILSRIWKPFYQTIDKVKHYHLSAQESLQLPHSEIDEFSLLNENITGMTERSQREYKNLKDFTGNAAHEMQTPLAVIRTKLDLLMQNEKLLADKDMPMQEIEQAVHKLSRLYASLLLLTKIENRQFALTEPIAIDKIIGDKLNDLSDLLESKFIQLHKALKPVNIPFHQQLAEILIGNLLNNAIRYNIENGTLSVKLDDNTLTISNTSWLPALDEKKIFQRFYRHADTKQQGNGLGLSIVKQICDTAGFKLSYGYSNQQHSIKLVFEEQ
jgi:signal transduction histidine kinase